MLNLPNPNDIYANEWHTTVFLKNVIKAPNIHIGDFTYYDDSINDPKDFEQNQVLFNYPSFGDHLIIGKFCQIAQGTTFIMGPANHRLNSVTTYPFNVMGGEWTNATAPHLSELPHKGDTIIGNDVWIGKNAVIMPGSKIGDGAIVAAYSVVSGKIDSYTVVGGKPAQKIKNRFDEELKNLLLQYKWWNLPIRRITEILPQLCSANLDEVRKFIKRELLNQTA